MQNLGGHAQQKMALGDKWLLIKEGFPGRTICFDDPIVGSFMNEQMRLKIVLFSHGLNDLLTIMLGTNDCKLLLGNSAKPPPQYFSLNLLFNNFYGVNICFTLYFYPTRRLAKVINITAIIPV